MAIPQPTFISVFDDPDMANNAIQTLKEAGFRSDQIYTASHHPGGFLEEMKSLFTNTNAPNENLSQNLVDMGLSNDEANYYEREYRAGHGIVAIDARGREQEALRILYDNSGHSYRPQNLATGTRTDAAGNPIAGSTISGTAPAGGPHPPSQTRTTATSASSQAGGMSTDAAGNPIVTSGGANIPPQPGIRNVDDVAASNQPLLNETEEEQRRLHLREEQLNIEKRPVQSGEVRIHKQVVTEQKNIDVPVSHEEVQIEYHPASQNVVDTTPIGEGETIHVPLTEEQINVTKRTVPTGDVNIKKQTVEGTQSVRDTIKHEEAKVDSEGYAPVREVTEEQSNLNVEQQVKQRPGRQDNNPRQNP